jgi:hypothetical protein
MKALMEGGQQKQTRTPPRQQTKAPEPTLQDKLAALSTKWKVS